MWLTYTQHELSVLSKEIYCIHTRTLSLDKLSIGISVSIKKDNKEASNIKKYKKGRIRYVVVALSRGVSVLNDP